MPKLAGGEAVVHPNAVSADLFKFGVGSLDRPFKFIRLGNPSGGALDDCPNILNFM